MNKETTTIYLFEDTKFVELELKFEEIARYEVAYWHANKLLDLGWRQD